MYVHHTGGSALVYVNEGLRIAKPSLAQSRSQSGADSVNRGAVFRPIFYSWNYTLLLPRKSAGQGPCSLSEFPTSTEWRSFVTTLPNEAIYMER